MEKNKITQFMLDIETLGTPEVSGYGIVIPNYAFVKIPEVLTHELEWLYVMNPIQPQLDNGLKVNASTMDFWFNFCAKEFPDSLNEMKKSFTLNHTVMIYNDAGVFKSLSNPYLSVKNFLHKDDEVSSNVKVFGNGCHFDCSILQENFRAQGNLTNLWHYSSPNNIRTLRLLLNEQEESDMKEAVDPVLEKFCDEVNSKNYMEPLALHNPLYDAAKEALYTTFIMNLKKSA